MKRIQEIFAFVVVKDGHEGVLRRQTPFGTQPMIADSKERLMLFYDDALSAGQELGARVDIARFVRADEE